jgi:hypothetical protein
MFTVAAVKLRTQAIVRHFTSLHVSMDVLLKKLAWRRDTATTYSVVSILLVNLTWGTILQLFKDHKRRESFYVLTMLCGTTAGLSLTATAGYMLLSVFFGGLIQSAPRVGPAAVKDRLRDPAVAGLRIGTAVAFNAGLFGLAGVYMLSLWVSLPDVASRYVGIGLYAAATAATLILLYLHGRASRPITVGHACWRG